MLVKDPKVRRFMEKFSGKTFAGEIRKNKEQIARSMKSEGADLHFIARVTGLSFDDVLNI